MKNSLTYIICLFFLWTSCGMLNKNKDSEKSSEEITLSPEELEAIKKAKQDSIEKAEFELTEKTAVGDVQFGMDKQEVEKLSESNQKLGKYSFNSTNIYNGDGQLYSLVLDSNPEKAINYDNGLKSKYWNLYKILNIKYGEPETNKGFPSIFDVQKTGTYWINVWHFGTKEIKLGLKEHALNSYTVRCNITDSEMQKAEIDRLQKIKDKDYIEAAKKL